ncbi:hypothetical protein EJ04DRAFT_523201 [Polyplosphaeria fusca]|uniref:Uncharacterized protein n=1 Tax=Polyplosphaeria fusca TaxID=682080 RepID=A0A9P4QVZ9_9PLEO|nr:hypothetical protein EJ04DRAFT_523201 [Polyplosphaeria fusca]
MCKHHMVVWQTCRCHERRGLMEYTFCDKAPLKRGYFKQLCDNVEEVTTAEMAPFCKTCETLLEERLLNLQKLQQAGLWEWTPAKFAETKSEMCKRYIISYSCCHRMLDTIAPFFLCGISRLTMRKPCLDLRDVIQQSQELCIDCFEKEHVVRRERFGSRGGEAWTGYAGEWGVERYCDDVPQ